ncbi:hypothetical protein P5E99_15895, partial [Clostridium perfringens]|nr:hypothetical protein [Clostridium perfringens]
MSGGTCSKEKLDDSWMKETEEPHCISKLAVLDSTFALGGPHEDVELRRYLQPVKQGQRQLIVTRHHCYPVQEIYAKVNVTNNGVHVLDSTMVTLTNLKLSVDDPSVFSLPSICDKLPYSSKRNNDKNLPVDP